MLVDFWRLIYQERTPTIVMVTNLKEGNKKKCEQYWPDSGSKNFGPFRVTLTEQQVFADYTTRTLQVTVSILHLCIDGCPKPLHNVVLQLEHSAMRPLKVKQYHFTSWPDHGVPEYATSMLSFHKKIISQHKTSRGPILVHCRYVDQCVLVQMLWLTLYSAGVGRTGTFICIDNVLEQIKKEKVVDIAGAINKMRHQRMKMVQTHVRLYIMYSYVCSCIIPIIMCIGSVHFPT